MAQLPLDQAIDRFKENEDRADLFINGPDNQDWETSDGRQVPTLSKFVKTVNEVGEGWLARAETAATIAQSRADIVLTTAFGSAGATLDTLTYDMTGVVAGATVRAGDTNWLYQVSDTVADYTGAAGVHFRVLPSEGSKSLSARQFKIVSSPVLDQFARFNAAIQRCSVLRLGLNIDGLEIRIGKQQTSDNTYKYVRDGNPGGASKRTYAIKLDPGAYMRLIGKGTIGNLNANDKQYIFHSVDSDYVEIGDGVTLDGYHTTMDWGGCLHLMGLARLHLGDCTIWRDDVVRFGASVNRRSGEVTMTTPYFLDGRGSFAFGGKPGGFERARIGAPRFENVAGWISFENEDEDGFNTDGTKWPTKINATVDSITAFNTDGSFSNPSGTTNAGITVQDGRYSVIQIGKINCDTLGSGGSGFTSSILKIGGGQENKPAASVTVDEIYAVRTNTILHYDATDGGGERIYIGKVTGTNITRLIDSYEAGGSTTVTEGAKSVTFGQVDVSAFANNSGGGGSDLFNVAKKPENTGWLIQKLNINGLNADTARAAAGYSNGAKDITFGNYEVGQTIEFSSSRPFGNVSLYLDCESFNVTGRLRLGKTHNRAVMLSTTARSVINEFIVDETEAAGALYLAGSGDVTINAGRLGQGIFSAQALYDYGYSISSVPSYTGKLILKNLDANGHTINPYLNVSEIRNSDIVQAVVTLNPGTIAAGQSISTSFTVNGAKVGDFVRAQPKALLTNHGRFLWQAVCNLNNSVAIVLTNVSDTATDPGSRDWLINAERFG